MVGKADGLFLEKEAGRGEAETLTFSAQDGGSVQLPDADFISQADLSRDGQDLILTAPDGSVVVIEGYFLAEPPPLIQGPGGATLTPGLVDSFVHGAGEARHAAAGTETDESPVGIIKEVSGKATIMRADGTTEEISIGMPVFEGDVIETSEAGSVNIVFRDESSFAVSENAKLAIDEYVFDPSTESGESNFSMLRGMFIYTSGLIGREDPDDVEIDTPIGSIGIRGTVIAGNIDTGEITVVEGAIVLRPIGGGEEMTLADKFQTAKFDGGQVIVIGTLSAEDVVQKFSSFESVSADFINSISNDTGGEDPADEAQPQDESPAEDTGTEEAPDQPEMESGEAAMPEAAPMEAAPLIDTTLATAEAFDFSGESAFDADYSSFDAAMAESADSSADFFDAAFATEPAQEPASAEDNSAGSDPAPEDPVADTTNEPPPPPPPASTAPPPPPNDFAPAIANDWASFNMPENSTFGAAVGPVSASDADGDTLTYSITSGNVGNVFSVDSSGTLRINGSLDFETMTAYSLVVSVSDGVHSTDANYTINISDIDESPTVSAATFALAENTPVTSSVGTVTATDPETPGTLNYAITAGNTGGAFAINAATGEITVLNPLNFETTTSYSLTVAVDDGVNAAVSSTITINVTDVDDTSPVVGVNTGAATSEGGIVALTGAMLSSSDVDTAASGLTYTVTTAPANGQLELTTNPGVPIGSFTQTELAAGQVVYVHDGSNTAADSFTFSVDDGTNAAVTGQVFNLTVTAVNDAPVLDLDLNDSSVGGADHLTNFTEGTMVAVVDTDVSVLDSDNANMQSASVTLTNNLDGTAEYLYISGANITAALGLGITVTGTNTNTITLSGTAPLASYQAVLQTIMYNNNLDNPDPTDRLIDIQVSDGALASNTATATVTVTPVADADVFTGTAGSDTFIGDGGDDDFLSSGGSDTLTGAAGDDIFRATNGDGSDTISGGTEATQDVYDGFALSGGVVVNLGATGAGTVTDGANIDTFTGLERIVTGTGSDTFNVTDASFAHDLDGSGGTNLLNFSALGAGNFVNIDINGGTASVNGGATNTFNNFQSFNGSLGNDTFTAFLGDGNQTLNGMAGTLDTYDASAVTAAMTFDLAGNIVSGGAGTDNVSGIEKFIGGSGTNTLMLTSATAAVNVDLSIASGQVINNGAGGTFTVIGMDDITGSVYNDMLKGDSGNNQIAGGSGNDTLVGGAGNDTLTGGANIDTVNYSAASAGIDVTLSGGNAAGVIDGNGGTDTLSGIEKIIGSAWDDIIEGDFSAIDNLFDGGAGADILGINVIPFTMNNADGDAMHIYGGNSAGDVDEAHFFGTGAIIIDPDGTQDFITEVEVYRMDFGTNNTISIWLNDFMIDANEMISGDRTLTIQIDGSDDMDLHFGPLTSNYVVSGGSTDMSGGPGFIEFHEQGGPGIVRVEYTGGGGMLDIYGIGMGGALDLNSLIAGITPPMEGFAITNGNARSFGSSLASLGDRNHDGYDDLAIVNAVNIPNNGEMVTLYGRSAGYVNDSVSGWSQGGANFAWTTGLFNIGVSETGDMRIASAGDFNGDGFTDYIIGAPLADDSTTASTGNAQIISGDGSFAVLTELVGLPANGSAGMAVSGIGDINGDGYEDVVIGAPDTSAGNGKAYVLLGSSHPDAVTDVTALNQPEVMGSLGTSAFSADAADIAIFDSPAGGMTAFVMKDNFEIAVVDVSDPSSPSMISTINAAFVSSLGHADALQGLTDIAVAGKYLFILSGDTNGSTMGQITVLDITNPGSMTLVDTEETASLEFATSLDVDMATGRLVVVTSNGGASTLITYSVNTTNGVITPQSSVMNTLFVNVGQVEIHGNHAYAFAPGGLVVTNITNMGSPGTPSLYAQTNITSLFVDDKSGLLYAVTNNGGASGDLKIYDITTTPGTPSLIGSINLAAMAGASDVFVNGDTAFVTTNSGVVTLNVENPATIGFMGPLSDPGPTMTNATSLVMDADGVLHVVSGGGTDTLTSIDVKPDGLTITPQGGGSLLGMNISSAGDFNNDGMADFLVTAPDMNKAYVVLGMPGMNNVDLSTAPANVIHFGGINVDISDSEVPVFNMGDINGDGISDIAIAHTGGSGQIDIHFGSSGGNNVSDVTITPGGSYEIIGGGSVGDFNGDGFDDAAIVMRDTSGAGDQAHIYVLYGGDSLAGSYTSGTLNNTANAFHITYTIPAGASFGNFDFDVTAAGDINGDGFYDLAIALPDLDTNTSVNSDATGGTSDDPNGAVAVIYGRDTMTGDPVVQDNDVEDGSATAGEINATATMQSLVGNTGANILRDNGWNDVSFHGGAGNDIIELTSGNFNSIDGGGGMDAIKFMSGGTLNFSSFNALDVQRIEKIDMTVGTAQTLVLTLQNIFGMMQQSDTGKLYIAGAGADALVIDDQGAGTLTGANKDALAQLLGADSVSYNGTDLSYDFSFGGHTLQISQNLIDSGNTDVV